jgi:hypothetical protein
MRVAVIILSVLLALPISAVAEIRNGQIISPLITPSEPAGPAGLGSLDMNMGKSPEPTPLEEDLNLKLGVPSLKTIEREQARGALGLPQAWPPPIPK